MSESIRKVIVLGGSGFIGKRLCDKLTSDERVHLMCPDSKTINLLKPENVRAYFKENLTSETSLIIAAAKTPYSSVPKDDPKSMMDNRNMVQNIIDSISSGCKELIYLSTIDVYGDSAEIITEQTSLLPKSNYAKAKFDAERILQGFSSKQNIPLLILRLSQVYGKNDNSPKLIPSLITSAIENSKMTISGSGITLRDFVAVDDVVAIIVLSIGQKVHDIVNLATGVSVPILKIAEIIKGCAGKQVVIDHNFSVEEKKSLRFNNSKFKQYFDYKFSNLEDELMKCILNYERKRT